MTELDSFPFFTVLMVCTSYLRKGIAVSVRHVVSPQLPPRKTSHGYEKGIGWAGGVLDHAHSIMRSYT